MKYKKHIKDWKHWVFCKAEKAIKKTTTPLLVKELAWKAVNFTVNCDESNPLSYALRPVVNYKHIQKVIGLNLIIFALVASVWGPIPSLASDTGGILTVGLVDGVAPLTTQEAISWPVPSRQISQGYWLLHAAIDIRTPMDTPIVPIMRGVVIDTEDNKGGYGNKVVVRHESGMSSLYAHLSKIIVKVGDSVTTETTLGLSGSTGRSTGPHLHLEVINQSGQHINPMLVLNTK